MGQRVARCQAGGKDVGTLDQPRHLLGFGLVVQRAGQAVVVAAASSQTGSATSWRSKASEQVAWFSTAAIWVAVRGCACLPQLVLQLGHGQVHAGAARPSVSTGFWAS